MANAKLKLTVEMLRWTVARPTGKQTRTMLGSAFFTLILLSSSGCGNSNRVPSREIASSVQRGGVGAGQMSKNHYLVDGDLSQFKRGQSMDEVLHNVQYRGDFDTAGVCRGINVYLIAFRLTSQVLPENGDAIQELEGTPITVLAVFVDGKFAKFISRPPDATEEDVFCGVKSVGPKPIRIGDVGVLQRALDARSLNIDDLRAAMKPLPPTTRASSRSDIGLTVVWLAFAPFIMARRANDLKQNMALRDQFNAERLRLGMNVDEVESVLGAQPLESGAVEGGEYRIYGAANTQLDVQFWLNFSNVLVVFHKGKVAQIFGVPAEVGSRQELTDGFIDFPKAPGALGNPPPFIGKTLAQIAEMRDPTLPRNETGEYLVSDKGGPGSQVWSIIYGGRSFFVQVDNASAKVISYRICDSHYQYRGI